MLRGIFGIVFVPRVDPCLEAVWFNVKTILDETEPFHLQKVEL
jgi:hypothetical protein